MIKFLKLNKLNFLLILIFIFYILNKIDFYQNVRGIIKNSEKDRITNIYGYCGGESIGYLKYLKTKYNFDSNPQIVNYDRTAPNLWSIFNTNNSQTSKVFKILLNYPGKEINVNPTKINDNLFEIYDIDFLGPLSNNFKIKLDNNKSINNLNLKFFTQDDTGNLKEIKNIKATKNLSENFFFINYNLEKININEKKLFLKIISDKLITDTNISFKLINKYQVDKLEILDKYENCYLVK